ncbi:MAG: tetratricopeptide repeat protein [Candidatus Omnitrophica bacterium]|nr:tetratricopeptide repeat protein [Candidatus Omnitrophota bacterium]
MNIPALAQNMSYKKTTVLAVVLIALVGFAVYFNSLDGKFIWDDDHLVKDNIYITNGIHFPTLFTTHIGSGANIDYSSYRPLQIVTYTIDYSFWKLDVRGYHLTNIILHILAAIALYWLIGVLFKNNLLALLTSLFFVCHPIHTEAVSYISGRADSLALLFMLLSLIFYIKKSGISYFFALTCYVLALLSRENAVMLIALVPLCCYSCKERINIKKLLPFLSVTLIYILLRVTFLSFHKADPTTLFQRIPGFFAALTTYVKLLFFPFGLHMEYGNKFFSFTDPQVLVGISILVLVLTLSFKKRQYNKVFFFSVWWFFLTLLPHSNLYPIPIAYMAEHWLYVPSIGFFLLLSYGLVRLYKTKTGRLFCAVGGLALLFFYSFLTVHYNSYWRHPKSLYERTVKYEPQSVRTLTSLAMEYEKEGREQDAIELFSRAISLDPKYAQAYNNLANLYVNIGKNAEAIKLYEEAIRVNPDYVEPYYNLGLEYSQVNNYEKAIEMYKKALLISPNYAQILNNLGVAYASIGKLQTALACFKKALSIYPEYVNARNNIKQVYTLMGDNKKSEEAPFY